MIYIVIFILFLPFVFLYEFNLDRKSRIFVSCFFLLMLVLLAGLRGPVDGDYENYLDIYEKLTKNYGDYSTIVEPGYAFLNLLTFKVNLGFNFLLLLISLISIFPKIIFFHQKSSNFPLSVIIFFSTSFFIFDFTQIRQACAIGIFMYSLKFILEKNFIAYLLAIIIASSFHVSSLILIPGYFIFNRSIHNNILYFIVIICSFISFYQLKIGFFDYILNNSLILDSFSGKLTVYQQSEIFSFISVKQFIFAILFIYIKKTTNSDSRLLNILVNLYIIGIFLATILNQISEISFRIKWYFFWTESILVLVVIKHFAKNNLKLKLIFNSVFVVYYFTILIILLDNLSNHGQFIYPYKFFFEL